MQVDHKDMKILFIHNKYKIHGGEESVFNNEIKLLRDNGHMIETVILDNADINSLFSKIRTALFSFYNPFSSKLIKKKVNEFRPDLIHVHNFFPLVSPSVFFKRVIGNVPIIMTLHNYRLICANAMLFRKNTICEKCMNKKTPVKGIFYKCFRNSTLQTLLLVLVTSVHKYIGTWRKKIDLYICLSEFQKQKFIKSSLELKKGQIEVKPNFVFDNGFDFEINRSFFLFVGRIEQEKGIDTLLDSFRNTKYSLKIIGEGPLQEDVKIICEENMNMEYLGVMDHEYVTTQMKMAKGLIFPSKNYEGFGMVIAESFSCGTPVITSDIGSQAEIVKNGINGLHFRVNDTEDLIKKVEELDQKYDYSMNKNARLTYEKNYNNKENYKLLIRIYERVIKENIH
ncbi:MAG: glycosyltransferase family 4 protein [Acidobacteriota bacterium]